MHTRVRTITYTHTHARAHTYTHIHTHAFAHSSHTNLVMLKIRILWNHQQIFVIDIYTNNNKKATTYSQLQSQSRSKLYAPFLLTSSSTSRPLFSSPSLHDGFINLPLTTISLSIWLLCYGLTTFLTIFMLYTF